MIMWVHHGGLSLRRKSKMLEIIDNCPYKNNINEDLYFTQECPEICQIGKMQVIFQ